jgi:hypothetical protein
VISWIVPFARKTKDDPRTHTNQHERNHPLQSVRFQSLLWMPPFEICRHPRISLAAVRVSEPASHHRRYISGRFSELHILQWTVFHLTLAACRRTLRKGSAFPELFNKNLFLRLSLRKAVRWAGHGKTESYRSVRRLAAALIEPPVDHACRYPLRRIE